MSEPTELAGIVGEHQDFYVRISSRERYFINYIDVMGNLSVSTVAYDP